MDGRIDGNKSNPKDCEACGVAFPARFLDRVRDAMRLIINGLGLPLTHLGSISVKSRLDDPSYPFINYLLNALIRKV